MARSAASILSLLITTFEEKQTSDEMDVDDDDDDPIARIQEFITSEKSMKFEYINGLSFLMYAIAMMEDELAVDILSHGIDYDINEAWDSGQTPLHCACQMHEMDVVRSILDSAKDTLNLYAITNDFLLHFTRWECGGKTVLHYGAMQGNIDICQLLLDFEYNFILKQGSIPKLLLMKDFQSNDAMDTALIYNHLPCAKWLYLQRKQYYTKHNINHDDSLIDLNLQDRMSAFETNKKMLNDSRDTKLRFEDCGTGNNCEAIIDEEDIFIIKNVWSGDECDYVLNALIAYGDKTNWKSNRYQSFATTDVALSMMDDAFNAFIRKELYYKLYPKIVEHYKFGNKFEIGAKYLFFVRYNDHTEYRNTYDMFKQNSLNLHRDGGLISFNILLNPSTQFVGGGTYFKNVDRVIGIEQGDSCVHPGNILHCGNAITKGKRYILVGFLNAKKIN
eukprot:141152_1